MKRGKVFSLVWVIIGTFIGAGFASGKEIATYFARFGFFSIVLAIIAGFLFYVFMKNCLMIGKNMGQGKYVYKKCFGKFAGIIKILIIIATFITIGSMIAGAYEIFGIFFPSEVIVIFLIILMLLVGIIVIKNYPMILKVNSLLIPALLGSIFMVCIVFLFGLDFDIIVERVSYFQGFSSLIAYVSFNMLSTGVFLIEIGEKYEENEINQASLISSGIITFFIILAGCSIYICGGDIIESSLPLVSLALNSSRLLGILMIGVVFIGLTTSLISDVFVLSVYGEKFCKNKILLVGAILILGYIISLLGFSFIVINLYAMLGGLGILFLITVLITTMRQKSNKKSL